MKTSEKSNSLRLLLTKRAKAFSKRSRKEPPMHSHTHEPPTKAERDALTAERFAIAAETVKQLADPTRMRVFLELCHKELCVSALASLLDVSSPAVFHHLRSLKEHALLESRRAGKEVYYRAADTETAARHIADSWITSWT